MAASLYPKPGTSDVLFLKRLTFLKTSLDNEATLNSSTIVPLVGPPPPNPFEEFKVYKGESDYVDTSSGKPIDLLNLENPMIIKGSNGLKKERNKSIDLDNYVNKIN